MNFDIMRRAPAARQRLAGSRNRVVSLGRYESLSRPPRVMTCHHAGILSTCRFRGHQTDLPSPSDRTPSGSSRRDWAVDRNKLRHSRHRLGSRLHITRSRRASHMPQTCTVADRSPTVDILHGGLDHCDRRRSSLGSGHVTRDTCIDEGRSSSNTSGCLSSCVIGRFLDTRIRCSCLSIAPAYGEFVSVIPQ